MSRFSFSDLRTMFGGSGPVRLSNFYSDSSNTIVAGAVDVPKRGQPIQVTRYRNKFKFPPITAGLTFWLDANDSTVTLEDTNKIVNIKTLIGNFTLNPNTSSLKPTRVIQNNLNKRAVIRFDGTSTQSIGLITSSSITWGSKWNVFYIINPFSSADGGVYLINVGNAREIPEQDYVYVPAGANYNARGNTATFDVNADFSFETDGNYNVRFLNYPTGPRFNGSSRTKSSTYTTNTTLAPASAPLHLCFRPAAASVTTKVNLAEIIIFNRDLSLDEIQTIEGYMAWKWGLHSKLPVSHPFYSTPPSTPVAVFQLLLSTPVIPNQDSFRTTLITSATPPSMVNDSVRGWVMSTNSTSFLYTQNSFSLASSYTKIVWVYLNSHVLNGNVLSSHTSTGAIHYLWYSTSTRVSAGHSASGVVTAYVTDTSDTPLNTWVHFAVTYDNTTNTMILYRNGVAVHTVTNAALAWSGSSLQLSIGSFNSTNIGNMYFDNIYVFNQALTVNQIKFFYDTEFLPSKFSHTFTNAGATGRTGPTLAQCVSAYSATAPWASNTADLSMTTNGYQRWRVPSTGNYKIECSGARGGLGPAGGRNFFGRIVEGTFSLNENEIVTIVVGQMGGNWNGSGYGGGGGGGTFVIYQNNALIVAGGGGGTGNNTNGSHGVFSPSGNGDGGISTMASGVYMGSGGGGYTGNGANGTNQTFGGSSYTNGAIGGNVTLANSSGPGGFGGGGGGSLNGWGGGGGGGYTGGNGTSGGYDSGGGGGTCFGTGIVDKGVSTTSHGYVKITQL